MILRSAIVGWYAALGIVVGVAFGPRGLAILGFFYLWAALYLVFVLATGRATQELGRRFWARRWGGFGGEGY